MIAAQEHVAFQWVKGHAGHPENERCDELAMLALTGEKLEVDQGYLAALTSDSSIAPGKIMAEGNACRKCNTAVVKKPPKKKQPKPGQDYYYEYYFFCPGCKTMYFTEDAKRAVDKPADNTLFG